jgi:hypothetical protein
MTRITSSLSILATLLALGLHAAPAQAQLARTYVSSLGNDANDCNRLTPCRTFQRAHDNTLALGEITVLDPGGYGAVTITKAISIINDGVGEAGVLVSGGLNGITISAGASDAVSLRGLTVKGIGFGGGNGVVFNSGASLTVENCALRNLTGSGVGVGVWFRPAAASTLAVSNTIVADNSAEGIAVTGGIKAVLSRVETYKNLRGVRADVGDVIVSDSVAANSLGAGFLANSTSSQVNLTVIRSVAANNLVGLSANGAGATVRVGQSTVTGNTGSWQATSGGSLQSFGDNYIASNGDGDPAPTTIAKK